MTATAAVRLTEKAWQAQVIDLAKLYGWTYYHTFLSVRSTPGFPDLLLVRPPRIVIAELKAEGKGATAHQQRWLDLLAACPGVEVYLWRPADLPRVVEVLGR
jgi:hypothetical protein